MRKRQGEVEAIASIAQIEQHLSDSLTVEQRQAIELVMTAPDAVTAWQGSAGVGKTYALNEPKAIALTLSAGSAAVQQISKRWKAASNEVCELYDSSDLSRKDGSEQM